MLALQEKYKNDVVGSLLKSLHLKNKMQVPRIEKVVLSSCLSEAIKTPKVLEMAAKEFTDLSGQKPVLTKSKVAIANFKLKEGVPLGVMVTLRRQRMWSFLERLIHIAIPKIRDFRGLSRNSFDGRGNYNMGIKEQIVFPEINYDKVDKIRGLNVTICTSAKTDAKAERLLETLGFPFR